MQNAFVSYVTDEQLEDENFKTLADTYEKESSLFIKDAVSFVRDCPELSAKPEIRKGLANQISRHLSSVLPLGQEPNIERQNRALLAENLFETISLSQPELRDEIFESIVWTGDENLIDAFLSRNYSYSSRVVSSVMYKTLCPRVRMIFTKLLLRGVFDPVLDQARLNELSVTTLSTEEMIYILKLKTINPLDQVYLKNLASYRKPIARSLIKNPSFRSLVDENTISTLTDYIRSCPDSKPVRYNY